MTRSKRIKRTILYAGIAATLVMVAYAQFILGSTSQCFAMENGVNSLGLSFGYSSQDVMVFLQSRSVEQLTCYIRFLSLWDTLFPLLYTAMYSLWIAFFFEKWRYLVIVPVLHMAADWMENHLEISFIDQYINSGILNEQLISFGSSVTMLKWILSVLTYSIILFGIISRLRHLLSRPRQH